MIKPKLKICSVCGDLTRLWLSIPPTCQKCHQRQENSLKRQYKHVSLTQTTDGKKAVPFKPIKKVSDKQAKLNRAYMVLRNAYLKNHPVCEIRWICKGSAATEVHHVKPRAFFLLDETVFKATCRACHDHINTHDAEARELGYLQSKHS